MATDGFDLIHPRAYGRQGAPHEIFTRLRAEEPLAPCEAAGFEPFRAVTRHADVCEISKSPDRFLNQDGIVVMRPEQRSVRASGEGLGAMRTIIEMDPPEHRSFRRVASPWFTPRAMARIDAAVDESARQVVDGLAAAGDEGECDFATAVATAHPLRILSTMLGVPREEEPNILRLTNQLFAADDPELQREGEDRDQAVRELGLELYQVFDKIIQDRRANPRDDIAGVLANARMDGQPMGPIETFGYYLIIFTAGHDTTKNALAGGMRALVENWDEFLKIKRDPRLVPLAVEEIVRWTSPVNYMRRTVARDLEFRGEKLREGEHLVLFYASANRDENVFDEPFRFRVDRDPNRHLGFGIGEHYCLGAHVARRSQRALLAELGRRLEWAELAGEPEWIHSSFVVGLKHLPVRYRIKR